MRYQRLGNTGLRVSEMFLGAMVLDDDGPRGELPRVIDAYADAGGNVLDTAVNYAGGRSEEVIGAALRGRRDRFVLSTKYTMARNDTDPNAAGSHRKNLVRSLDTSLRRLGTDHIDLYWVHLWDDATPLEETMRALDDAVRAGKILYTGFSNAPAWVVTRAHTLAQWHGWTPFAAIQVLYNLLNRDVERDLLPMAEHLGLSVAAWSPLAGGAVVGQGRPNGVAATGGTRQEGVVRTVADVAAELGATPSQVALAWTRARSASVHPIMGVASADHVTENLRALDLDLPAEALDRLDKASATPLGYPHDFIAAYGSEALGAAALPRVPARR